MHTPVINPPLLLVGALFSWLFVRMMRRGSIRTRVGTVERAQNPAGFWCVAAINALIVLTAFLMGFGILKK